MTYFKSVACSRILTVWDHILFESFVINKKMGTSLFLCMWPICSWEGLVLVSSSMVSFRVNTSRAMIGLP